jgi:hypothetical protein
VCGACVCMSVCERTLNESKPTCLATMAAESLSTPRANPQETTSVTPSREHPWRPITTRRSSTSKSDTATTATVTPEDAARAAEEPPEEDPRKSHRKKSATQRHHQARAEDSTWLLPFELRKMTRLLLSCGRTPVAEKSAKERHTRQKRHVHQPGARRWKYAAPSCGKARRYGKYATPRKITIRAQER